jgi:nucleoside-diphosphate-sugar epimerase
VKILLTGSTGFVGSAFARRVLEQGHELAGLVVPKEPIPTSLKKVKNLVWMRGTLERPPWTEVAAFAPEVCVHTAWITTPGVYLESQENKRFRDISLTFLQRVRQYGVNHIVGLGTCIEYQISNAPLSEDRTPVMPKSAYACCKNQLRLALEQDAQEQGFGVCWGRVFYPYGPGEHPSRLCSSIIEKLSRDERVVLKTPASTKDYIYIDDLAAALVTVTEKRFCGAINLGTGNGLTVREIAHHLGTLMKRPELIEEAIASDPDPFPFVVADASKLKALGWKAATRPVEGLRQLLKARSKKKSGQHASGQ